MSILSNFEDGQKMDKDGQGYLDNQWTAMDNPDPRWPQMLICSGLANMDKLSMSVHGQLDGQPPPL